MRGSTLNGWLVDNMNPDLNLYWMLLDVSVPPPQKKRRENTNGVLLCDKWPADICYGHLMPLSVLFQFVSFIGVGNYQSERL